jgi:hypothetical protein
MMGMFEAWGEGGGGRGRGWWGGAGGCEEGRGEVWTDYIVLIYKFCSYF